MQNRLPAHSDHLWAEGEDLLPSRFSLNGLWNFSYAENYEQTIKGFEMPGMDCRCWKQIRVPAHIQLEGYDSPQYVNTQYPWDGHEEIDPGEIPARFNPVGSYVKYFEVPDRMKNRPLFISFQGVESAFALWLNGHYVGYSEDSFTPSEFDLTPYVADGENKLAVQVFKWSAGSWCEDQDFFRFSGIFRDVFLYAEPEHHIRDLKITTDLDDDYANGRLKIHFISNSRGKVKITVLEGRRYDHDKLDDLTASVDPQRMPDYIRSLPNYRKFDSDLFEAWLTEEEFFPMEKVLWLDKEGEITFHIHCPVLWSAESPALYLVLIEVLDEQGRLCETILEKTGFRKFEIKKSIMHLNGHRIVFKGVNRHEFCAESGRVLPREAIIRDLVTIKQNNINAIRTSHYPNQTFFYQMCDFFGLYLIDEANLETHGVWDSICRGLHPLSFAVPGDRPEYQDLILDRANSMYMRDKNHPSILIWSCGNESFGGKDLQVMSDFFRRADPSRLVHYEGIYNDRRENGTSDIESTMYVPVKDIKAYLKKHRDKPYINCEYTHAMGNSCGAMHKYTDLTEKEPLFQGGFIWDYIDQCQTVRDPYGREYQAYGGDFGDRPSDYTFSGNGIAFGADRSPSPKMQEVKYNYQNIKMKFSLKERSLKIRLWNKNLFTNMEQYDGSLLLERDGVVIRRENVYISLEPEGRTQITYQIPESIDLLPGEYVFTLSFCTREDSIWAGAGHEIAFGQGIFLITEQEDGCYIETKDPGQKPVREKISDPLTAAENRAEKKDSSGALTVCHGWYNTGVRGRNFEVLFSNLQGGLISYRYGGRELLKQMPRPNFWRAMTDNDMANLLPFRAGQWKAAGMFCSTKENHGRGGTPYEVLEEEGYVAVVFTCHLPVKPKTDCLVRYEVYPDGEVKVKMTLPPCSRVGELPEFSMLFTMDASFDHLRWYGPGPAETYADRCHGKVGIYTNLVRENMAPYLVPQECGHKEEVRFAEVTDKEGRGLRFNCNGLGFSALPWSPQEIDNARHSIDLPPVQNTIVRVGHQMGIGGDDTWGALVHPEYRLDNRKTSEIEFSFKGII